MKSEYLHCTLLYSRTYADIEAQCQVYHVCFDGKMFSELCPNGTVYDQGQFSCRSWRTVDCSEEGLQQSELLVKAYVQEQSFVTNNLESENPAEDMPWRFRNE